MHCPSYIFFDGGVHIGSGTHITTFISNRQRHRQYSHASNLAAVGGFLGQEQVLVRLFLADIVLTNSIYIYNHQIVQTTLHEIYAKYINKKHDEVFYFSVLYHNGNPGWQNRAQEILLRW